MGTRDTIKNVQPYPSLKQDRNGHAQRWRLSGALLYLFLILFISNFYF